MGLAGSDPLFLARLDAASILPAITLGVVGLTSHYCLTNAFRAGDAGVVVPLDFMRVPLIAVVGWWLYGEPLDLFVLAGAALIKLFARPDYVAGHQARHWRPQRMMRG